MATLLSRVAIILVGALCFLSVANFANSEQPQFIVKGKVFCEVCRVNFINKYSEPMPKAEVKLECKDEVTRKVTYRLTGGETNDNGEYTLMAEGDHGEEYCEVTLVKSGNHECAEIPTDASGEKPVAEITLTTNNGFHDNIRLANPLSFTRKKALHHKCAKLLKELAEDKEDDEPLPN
ncbi:Anther-specific protein LAT52 [Sesamum alatum]|uniref:Anther-specific protein LAT52 n=1 Tax=Sesamum alatum TaxID=300844 RepID=A0AAE2CZ83_9LAMI|nr:Anther-specific protein LAT52 [Sesamum alatum]